MTDSVCVSAMQREHCHLTALSLSFLSQEPVILTCVEVCREQVKLSEGAWLLLRAHKHQLLCGYCLDCLA